METYHYHLQPYAGPATRHTCPQCGRRREFVYYVDNENRPVDPSCGRCNRQQKCGYHLTPSEFFERHPWCKEFVATPSAPVQPIHTPPLSYLPMEVVERSCRHRRSDNNLYRFLCTRFPQAQVDATFDRYQVGTAAQMQLQEGLGTSFPQIDTEGRVRQIKLMLYNPATGKRVKEGNAIRYVGKELLHDYRANLQQTFFGTHLLPQATQVGVVESEKTALVCHLFMPQFTWIATGGCSGSWSSCDTATLFAGKQITLFPDKGCEQAWQAKADQLQQRHIPARLFPIRRDCPANTDVADLLLE